MDMAKVLGSREKEILLPANSLVSDLLLALEDSYKEPFAKIVYLDARNLKSSIMLNGRNIEFLEGLNTVLNDKDTVFFLPKTSRG